MRKQWNGNRFSTYTSEELSTLRLIESMGDQLNHNTDEIPRLEDDYNKKLNEKTNVIGDHKGSWHGIEKPQFAEPGIAGVVDKLVTDMADNTSNLGVSTPLNVRAVFQYNNQADITKIKRLKTMGLNTVIVPKVQPWQLNKVDLDNFLDLHLNYGVYAIIEVNAYKLIGVDFQQELDWMQSIESHPAIIGFYSFDEPVWNSITKENQELAYTRIKSVTSKNVYMSDVPYLNGRQTMFDTYYTPDACDVYMINSYYSHENPTNIINLIDESITRLCFGSLVPPPQIIPTFPFYTESTYLFPPTQATVKAHIEGWKKYCGGNYAVFAHDNDLLLGTLDTEERYRKLVATIPALINSQPYKEKHTLGEQQTFIKPTLLNGGVYIGDGNLLKKYMVTVSELNFGTILANTGTERHITFNGVNPGDAVICNPLFMPSMGLIWNVYISQVNTITIRLTNITNSDIVTETNTWFVDMFVR